MRNIANYDVTAACGYVGCPLNGFKNPLAPLKLDTLSMRNIANYDVTAACGYVGCPLNGFKNPLAPLKLAVENKHLLVCKSGSEDLRLVTLIPCLLLQGPSAGLTSVSVSSRVKYHSHRVTVNT